jgi:hypothetical protein
MNDSDTASVWPGIKDAEYNNDPAVTSKMVPVSYPPPENGVSSIEFTKGENVIEARA